MLFTQPIFFVFFALVFAGVWKSKDNNRRKQILLIASYIFYAAWDWRFLILIFASTWIDYQLALGIERSDTERLRRRLLFTSLTVNLGLLGFFKYFNFFLDSATTLASQLGFPTTDRALGIILPVGISFFTFQTMSYTLDVYRRRLKPINNISDFALFVGFFPQLVAGPIVRASHFLPQLARRPKYGDVETRRWLMLFWIGFVKKACIADNLAPYVDQVFNNPELYTAGAVWIGVLLYTAQIYCDFSGYTDMAIACAGLLGYDLGRNFHFPYLAANLSEFWRRWHISLSSWLRDYLYIPLGGSRGSHVQTCRNLILTMLLGGLWHGAAWTFVAWGGLHGIGLVIHREWKKRIGAQWCHLPAGRTLATAMTFYFVCCGWILFRAQNFGDAATLLKAFIFCRSTGTIAFEPVFPAAFIALALVHVMASRDQPKRWLQTAPEPLFAAGYGIAAALALAFVPLRAEPFIYFQF